MSLKTFPSISVTFKVKSNVVTSLTSGDVKFISEVSASFIRIEEPLVCDQRILATRLSGSLISALSCTRPCSSTVLSGPAPTLGFTGLGVALGVDVILGLGVVVGLGVSVGLGLGVVVGLGLGVDVGLGLTVRDAIFEFGAGDELSPPHASTNKDIKAVTMCLSHVIDGDKKSSFTKNILKIDCNLAIPYPSARK